MEKNLDWIRPDVGDMKRRMERNNGLIISEPLNQEN